MAAVGWKADVVIELSWKESLAEDNLFYVACAVGYVSRIASKLTNQVSDLVVENMLATAVIRPVLRHNVESPAPFILYGLNNRCASLPLPRN